MKETGEKIPYEVRRTDISQQGGTAIPEEGPCVGKIPEQHAGDKSTERQPGIRVSSEVREKGGDEGKGEGQAIHPIDEIIRVRTTRDPNQQKDPLAHRNGEGNDDAECSQEVDRESFERRERVHVIHVSDKENKNCTCRYVRNLHSRIGIDQGPEEIARAEHDARSSRRYTAMLLSASRDIHQTKRPGKLDRYGSRDDSPHKIENRGEERHAGISFGLFRSEKPVSGVSKPRNDITVIVQVAVVNGSKNIDLRMIGHDFFHSVRS